MQAVSTTRPCTKRYKETIIIVTLGTIWPSELGGLSHRGDPSLGTILVMFIFILHQYSQIYLAPNFKTEVVKNVCKSKDQNGNFGSNICSICSDICSKSRLVSLFKFFDQVVENSIPENEGEK